MPYDAFVHSKSDAVIQLNASQASGAALPAWVRFDARTGSFDVDPNASGGFKGKIDVKVIARDNEGREATVLFRLFVGEKPAEEAPAPPPPAERPQGRSSLSEKLRLAAKRQAVDLPWAALVEPVEVMAVEPVDLVHAPASEPQVH
jgi:hypothetical protein